MPGRWRFCESDDSNDTCLRLQPPKWSLYQSQNKRIMQLLNVTSSNIIQFQAGGFETCWQHEWQILQECSHTLWEGARWSCFGVAMFPSWSLPRCAASECPFGGSSVYRMRAMEVANAHATSSGRNLVRKNTWIFVRSVSLLDTLDMHLFIRLGRPVFESIFAAVFFVVLSLGWRGGREAELRTGRRTARLTWTPSYRATSPTVILQAGECGV